MIKSASEVKTCLLIAIFQLTTAQQQSNTIPLVVIPGNSKSDCHSQQVRESTSKQPWKMSIPFLSVEMVCGTGWPTLI